MATTSIVTALIIYSFSVSSFNVINRDKKFYTLTTMFAKAPKKKQQNVVVTPEFSRIVNVGSLPSRRAVLCKLLAKDSERRGLALRFKLYQIPYFSANVTLERQSKSEILVNGKIEAHIKYSEIVDDEVVEVDFESLVLDNHGSSTGPSLEDAVDYDDEVDARGDIDVGELSAQYLALELI